MSKQRIAIIGGGPIGIEAAARAVEEGFGVTVYEAGAIGEHLRRWDHVTMFSPWELNRSPWGVERLERRGVALAPDDEYPTAREYRTEYLEPLARSLEDDVEIFVDTEVVGISRNDMLKGELIADEARTRHAFVLRVDGPEGLRFDKADVVIDATGVLSQPNPLGPGGLAAVGEEQFADRILRRIPDVDGVHSELAGRQILVVGHGHSAMTTLDSLQKLHDLDPDTETHWAFRTAVEPCAEIEDDPLPERARLDRFGNRASRGDVAGIIPYPESFVRRIEEAGSRLEVTLGSDGEDQTVTVDSIVANVGYRPDTTLFRELQVHLCYATEGPMKLAASLLAQSGSADCLDQSSGGVDTLTSPEPDFFVIGAKSYGRNPNFLLRVGFEQIDAVFGGGR